MIAQVALALVLLAAAGLMIRTFHSLRNVDAGSGPRGSYKRSPSPCQQGSTKTSEVAVQKVPRYSGSAGGGRPASYAVGFASRVPLADTGPSAGFFIENKTPAGTAPPQQEFRYVSPDFFKQSARGACGGLVLDEESGTRLPYPPGVHGTRIRPRPTPVTAASRKS